jgi:hypothetical protein
MSHLYHQLMQRADRLGPHEWFWVLAAMIVVAIICMRGFGSRSQY